MNKEKLKTLSATVKKTALAYANDVLILAGASVAVYSTFRINATAGFYALSGVMVAVGWYLTQNPINPD